MGVFDEGRVEVTGAGGAQTLSANQETSVARGQAPSPPAPLRRFAARRAAMQAHRRRLETVRRGWRALAAARRAAMRRRALARQRALRRRQGRLANERRRAVRKRLAPPRRQRRSKP